MLKEGDIVICVNVDPPPDAPLNRKAQRYLVLGEVYEITLRERRVFHSVRVAQKVMCCSDHPGWLTVVPQQDITWRADRFKKVGSTK